MVGPVFFLQQNDRPLHKNLYFFEFVFSSFYIWYVILNNGIFVVVTDLKDFFFFFEVDLYVTKTSRWAYATVISSELFPCFGKRGLWENWYRWNILGWGITDTAARTCTTKQSLGLGLECCQSNQEGGFLLT